MHLEDVRLAKNHYKEGSSKVLLVVLASIQAREQIRLALVFSRTAGIQSPYGASDFEGSKEVKDLFLSAHSARRFSIITLISRPDDFDRGSSLGYGAYVRSSSAYPAIDSLADCEDKTLTLALLVGACSNVCSVPFRSASFFFLVEDRLSREVANLRKASPQSQVL